MQELEITFHQQVEELFVRLRGRGVAIPNRDWPVISDWAERQVPFSLIERLMVEGFKKRPDISSIRYFGPQIEEEMKRRVELQVGAQLEVILQEEAASLNQRVEGIKQHLADACDQLEALHSKVSPATQFGLLSIGWELVCLSESLKAETDMVAFESKLEALTEKLMETMENQMDPEELKKLVDAAKTSLHLYQNRVTKEVWEDMVRRKVRSGISERYKLPKLSLFYLD